MNPVRAALRYPQVTLVLSGMLFVAGFYALLTMPRREDPKITIHTGIVAAIYPGATTTEVEDQVTRKIEELYLAKRMERELTKGRILELYLNVIEWGNGVFGAEAAARRYFGIAAADLSAEQAARLAAMAPNPRFYERNQGAPGLGRKTAIILARMPSAELP